MVGLMLCVIAAAALRMYGFAGYVGLDDSEYARLANQVLNNTYKIGEYKGPAVFSLRVGIYWPVALSFRVFGISEWSMVLYPFVVSMMSLILVYLLANHFFGHRAGLISASIWAVLPIELQYNATTLVPDLPAAFYASLAVMCTLVLIRWRGLSQLAISLGGTVAGGLLGISWLCKESVTYLFPFFLILLVSTIRKDVRRNTFLWLGIALGALGILIGEALSYHQSTGDWLFRFHEIQRNQVEIKDGFFSEGSRWGWPEGGSYYRALMKRLFVTGPQTIFLNMQLLYLPLIGVLAALYAYYWKDKSFYIPALWLLSLCIMFIFATTHFSYYAPLALFDRYLYPVCFPAVIIVAGFFNKLLMKEMEYESQGTGRERFFWGATLAVFVCLVVGYQTFYHIRYGRDHQGWAAESKIVSTLLKPSDRIYTDILSAKSLQFFWQYPEKAETIDFEGMKLGDEIPRGSFVFVQQRAIDWLELNSGMWLTKSITYSKPDFLTNRPQSWKSIWENGGSVLYLAE